jgi:hypothetical protein
LPPTLFDAPLALSSQKQPSRHPLPNNRRHVGLIVGGFFVLLHGMAMPMNPPFPTMGAFFLP